MSTKKKTEARGFERKFGKHVRKCACGASYTTEAKRGRPFTRCPKCREK